MTFHRSRHCGGLLLVSAVALLSACASNGSGDSAATPTQTPTPLATATIPPPATNTATAVPTESATPFPTATDTVPPTNSPTAIPTKTATPLATASDTVPPTSSPTVTPTTTATPVATATDTPTETQTPNPAFWRPSVAYPSLQGASPRGWLDLRGLIHAHSVYSHDACDNMPVKNGVRDPVCFDDFRRGLCQSKHDFVMLTDHNESFGDTPYPEALLYRAERGDQLIERNGQPIASWAGCPDSSHALILAGTESGTMPVGLEGHVADQPLRSEIYNATTPEAIEAERADGAVSMLQHTENWTVDQLTNLPIDGFEMYNVHANLLLPATIGKAVSLIFRLAQHDPGFPQPDLVLLLIITEDPRYLTRWGSTLASGQKRVTTLATDCHRNTFPQLMQDGERVDSYRRMMMWFSNHLLVQPNADGSWDDRSLKDALRAERLYGAFEVMGYPQGFDYRAEVGSRVAEMGEEVALADGPVLRVARPSVRNLDPTREPPLLTLRILRAIDGGFEEVASGNDALAFTPTQPGAYRAEVRMVPLHLREDLGSDAPTLLAKDFVWIYSNAIYVR